MRFRASAPVTWPTDAAWRIAWRRALSELEESTVDASGVLVLPEQDDVGPDEPEIRLSSGTHLQPGALYTATFPGVTVLNLAMGIGGPAHRRPGHLQLRNNHHRGRLLVDVDSLDDLASITARSDIDHLGLDVTLTPDREAAATIEVRLDWLRVRATAHVEGAGDEEVLVLEGSVTGRRQWRPVLAPLLSTVGRLATLMGREVVAELARPITDIAIDPAAGPLDPLQRRERDVQRAAAIMSARAATVATLMAERSWWRRRRPRSWVEVLATLPPARWPASEIFESWPKKERRLLTTYVRRHRSRPPGWIGEELIRSEEAVRGAPGVQAAVHTAVPDTQTAEPTPMTDAELDLSWLATPWSTIRQMSGRTDQSDAETEAEVRESMGRLTRWPRWWKS